MKNFSIKLSGPAGAGMMQAGELLSKALNRLGFYSLMYPEYPSRIRGGVNQVLVVFSDQKEVSPSSEVDLTLDFSLEKIGLAEIGKKLGKPLVANTAGLGFIYKTLGLELKTLSDQISEEFKNKEEIKKLNLKAASLGYAIGTSKEQKFEQNPRKIVNFSGNEALVEGILAADCGFAAIYPMTPINSILNQLADSKVTVFLPEDEIAGIMAALGASFSGKRAMVATSGGGFSLMVEGLGMAGMAEIPLVCVVGQRTGPSTGMATFSSQADLNFVINAGQGEFPRIVLAPGDIGECFRLAGEAFKLAEKYRIPVILLTDKYLAESRFSADSLGVFENKKYPRILPGQTVIRANSYEHDKNGFSTDDLENREEMMAKRSQKLDDLTGGFERYGNLKSNLVLVGWGSTKGVILEYLKDHPQLAYYHVWQPWPFPQELVDILKKSEKITVIEGNYSGQLADLVERYTFKKVKRILKDNGRPIYKEELNHE